MCRITGFIDVTRVSGYEPEEVIVAMRDTMTVGGPDDAGIYIDRERGMALGHRRLSILDLSPKGHQPMCNDDGSLWIAYNGEVYNFCEIRSELEQNGYRFVSQSDTEVILKAYELWGINAVNKFRGMWAFVVWDKREKKLILCRDRVGVKPLYWYYKDGLFMFSSELKAFHKHPRFNKELDIEALSLYLQYGYITSPYSIFKHVRKLEPGHYLSFDKNGKITSEQYWDAKKYFLQGFDEKDQWLKRSDEDVAEELEIILTESFKLRMVSDVPVGMFLSGGIDSSLVTALLQKEYSRPLKTFTIGFREDDCNEAPWAEKIARHIGTEHTELYCTAKDAVAVIEKLPVFYDEPFGDSSAIPTFLVSQLAKKDVKVSLSADGGDEQFCGYTKYWILGEQGRKMNKSIHKSILSKSLNCVSPDLAANVYRRCNLFLPKWNNFRDKYIKLRNVLSVNDVRSQIDMVDKFFIEEELNELGLADIRQQTFKMDNTPIEFISQMMLFDVKTYMPDDILVKVDRATMNVSLEGREPFLDNKILEYSARMPINFKYKNKKSKYILRKILYKYIPPKLIERPKQGFGIPLHQWLQKDLKILCADYLSETRIKKEGILNSAAVNRFVKNYFDNKGISPHKIWFLLMFQMWQEQWNS